MTVTDPIFPSLWDATLTELGGDTAVWEVYGDSGNFHDGEPFEAQADAAEVVLHRLLDEGWATFIRRPWDAPAFSPGDALSDDAIKQTLARTRAWFLHERCTVDDLPSDLNVWLAPTPKWSDRAETWFA
jgi:hypothetical protein